jgi:anti-sigma regulatory factor (Ser/Thr protein kinase)
MMSISVPLDDASRIGEARRVAIMAGGRAGFDLDALSNLGIVATELATNAVRHARGGQLILRTMGVGAADGVEMICIDRGPGITNVAQAMRDGYSTAGTMGHGLGAIRRLAQVFEIISSVDGTAVLTRLYGKPVLVPRASPAVATICLPMDGETHCGDGWAVAESGTRMVLFMVDGLGHGVSAEDAALVAIRLFSLNAERPAEAIIDFLHRGLHGTRGAAIAVAEIDLTTRRVRYAGVGNITGWIVTDGGTRGMVSQNGIAGHQVRRIQHFEYPLPPDATIVMHSDGLSSKWKTDQYPGLLRRDPALLASVLYRDCARQRDDSSILVYKTVNVVA